MPLHIHSQYSISQIQQQFHQRFPSAKLEFSFSGNEPMRCTALNGKSFPSISIAELMHETEDREIVIEESMTASEVETLFRKIFHLPVQVFLKQGGYWLKNALCNSLPLGGQPAL